MASSRISVCSGDPAHACAQDHCDALQFLAFAFLLLLFAFFRLRTQLIFPACLPTIDLRLVGCGKISLSLSLVDRMEVRALHIDHSRVYSMQYLLNYTHTKLHVYSKNERATQGIGIHACISLYEFGPYRTATDRTISHGTASFWFREYLLEQASRQAGLACTRMSTCVCRMHACAMHALCMRIIEFDLRPALGLHHRCIG